MAARFGIALVLSAMLVGSAGAQTTHFFDNFDSYTDQANFEASWPQGPGADNVTLVPSNFLLTAADTGGTPTPVSGVNMVGLPTTTNRNQRFMPTGTGMPSMTNVVSFSFDFYDADATVAPFRQYSNMQYSTAVVSNSLVSMGLNNNQGVNDSGGNFYMARIVGYNPVVGADPDAVGPDESKGGTNAYFKLNDFGVGLRSTGWHNLRVDLSSDDGQSTDYSFYVDGVLAETVKNVGAAAAPADTRRSYDLIRIGSGITSLQSAYIDNVSVVLNPNGVVQPTNNADFNGDNIVDGADFLIWQKGFGTGNNLASGDANNDLAVNDADLTIWKNQFGTDPTPATAAVGAVPEPTTLALAGLAMVAAGLAARRR